MTSPRTRWFGLLFISLAVSLIIVDSTIINVSIPSIIEDLGITSTQVQWVQESYTLVFAALILVFGALSDRFGRRRLLLIGMTIFVISSVIAGFSQDGNLLIAARVLQGFGGAMVLPTTLSLVNANFQGKERGIAFAIWGSTIGGMVAVGPLLGGWLTTDYSWRWAFGINIPIGIIIIIGALLTVPESKEDGNTGRIDWLGAVYSVIAMSTLVFGLIEGRTYGWWEVNKPFTVGDWTWPGKVSIIPVMFLVFVLATTLFIAHGAARLKKGKQALIAFKLFGIASFRNGNIAAMVIALGEFGIILSLPLWLQFVIGYDALQTGFVLLGLAGGAFVASGLAGGLSGKVSPVAMVRLGIILEIIGVAGVGFAISKKRRGAADFPGAARIIDELKTGPKRRLVGLSASGARPVRDGVILRHNDKPVGSVTSGGFAPSLDRPAALGFVEAEFAVAGTSLLADTRGTPTAITVSARPFVQHQYFR